MGGYIAFEIMRQAPERVAKLARVVNVSEIKLSGLNRPRNPIRAELVLATYMYRPVGSAPAPKAK